MSNQAGARIKKIRETLNMKQKDFAQKLGISAPTLSELEAGNNKPSFDTIIKLSELFNINLYFILFGKGEMFENPLLEFLFNLNEADMVIKFDYLKEFLGYFAKSKQVQFHIGNQFELKMMADKDSILKEIAAREKAEK